MSDLTKAQLCALYMLQGRTSTEAGRLAGYSHGDAHTDAIRIYRDVVDYHGEDLSWLDAAIEEQRGKLSALARLQRAKEVIEASKTEWARFLKKSDEEHEG